MAGLSGCSSVSNETTSVYTYKAMKSIRRVRRGRRSYSPTNEEGAVEALRQEMWPSYPNREGVVLVYIRLQETEA